MSLPMEREDLRSYVEEMIEVLLFDYHRPEDLENVFTYILPLWDIAANFGVPVRHARVVRRIDKQYGTATGRRYRAAAAVWSKAMAQTETEH